jgi:LAO/AO transport system kinase
MDAFGKEIVIVETVGVGQDEVEIVKTADTVLVVCMPGMGDGVQAIKAGIMEIADIFVVNKCDRDGAEQAVSDIQAMLDLCSETSGPSIPIFKTAATTGAGMDSLADQLYWNFQNRDRKDTRYENQIRSEILGLLEKEIARHIRRRIDNNGWLDKAIRQVTLREQDPYSIVGEIMTSFIGKAP